MTKLTDKQERFCNEYLLDLNATQAYIRAGYAVKKKITAEQNSAKLLKIPKVQEYIREKQQERQKRTEITQDMVVKELAAIGFANGSDFAKVIEKTATDECGNPIINQETGEPLKYKAVEVMLTDDLDKDKKKALASIKQGKYGVEVSTCDKNKALELLGRHLGMFTDKLQIDGPAMVQIIDDVPKGSEQ